MHFISSFNPFLSPISLNLRSWISFCKRAGFLLNKQKSEQKVKIKNLAGIFDVPRMQIEKQSVIKNNVFQNNKTYLKNNN